MSLLLLQHVFTWGADKWFRRILVWSALAIYLAETAALQWLSGGSVSLLWARRIDWQAPLIGIDVATRCVSVLWLLISPGTQRWLQPPPCCHHRSKMGVTMIKSALKHRLNESNLMYMCVCVCTWECMCGCTRVPQCPDCIAIVFTSDSLLHPLISHSSPTHLCAPASPVNLLSKQNNRLQWQLHKCWACMAKIRSLSCFWGENDDSFLFFFFLHLFSF